MGSAEVVSQSRMDNAKSVVKDLNRLERAFSALFRPLSVLLDITG
jgi:hypothetical protein